MTYRVLLPRLHHHVEHVVARPLRRNAQTVEVQVDVVAHDRRAGRRFRREIVSQIDLNRLAGLHVDGRRDVAQPVVFELGLTGDAILVDDQNEACYPAGCLDHRRFWQLAIAGRLRAQRRSRERRNGAGRDTGSAAAPSKPSEHNCKGKKTSCHRALREILVRTTASGVGVRFLPALTSGLRENRGSCRARRYTTRRYRHAG